MNISETFFSSTVIEWNKLIILIIRNRLVLLKNKSSNSPDQILIVHLMWIILMELIKLLTRLQVGLSHLHEHKFRHNFQDSLDPFCNCSRHIETTIHFFLHCSNYLNQRKTLFEKIINMKHIEPK